MASRRHVPLQQFLDNAAASAPRGTMPGSFIHDTRPVTPRRVSSRPSPDPHDLSLHNVTRDSMVENMLSTFDQIPNPDSLYAYPDQSPPSARISPSAFAAPPSSYHYDSVRRHRRGSTSSSFNSDYSLHATVPTHDFYNFSRHGRSASGPKSYGGTDDDTTIHLPSSPHSASQPSTTRGSLNLPRPRKGSIGSSSADAHSRQPSRSLSSRFGRRSRTSSVDKTPAHPMTASPATQPASASVTNSILNRARPVPVEYHDFDAPSALGYDPTLPGGAVPPSHITYAAQRSVNTRQPHQQASSQLPSSVSANLLTQPRTRGLGLSETTDSQSYDHNNIQATRSISHSSLYDGHRQGEGGKEKQGFFKRVFGSSKSNHASSDLPPQLPPLSLRVEDRNAAIAQAQAQNQFQAHSSSPTVPPPINTTASAKASVQVNAPKRAGSSAAEASAVPEDNVQTVRKKASFFGRRKKPAGEQPPMPSIDTAAGAKAPAVGPPRSKDQSISSLEKVMNSYLHESAVSPEDQFFDSREIQPQTAVDDNVYRFGSSTTTAPPAQSSNSTIRPTHINIPPRSTSASNLSPPVSTQSGMDPMNNSEHSPSVKNGGLVAFLSGSHAASAKSSPRTPRDEYVLPLQDVTNRHVSPVAPLNRDLQTGVDAPGQYPTTWLPPSAETPSEADSAPVLAKGAADRTRQWLNRASLVDSRAAAPIVQVGPPAFSAAGSPLPEDYVSATSSPIIPNEVADETQDSNIEQVDELQPTPDDRELAANIFHGKDGFASQAKVTAALGDATDVSARVRMAYMAFFDFSGLAILAALRSLCKKLTLKGETQQVDRILASFSNRWCESNPSHGFKSPDVVHTICYSIILLNTDLHIADLDTRMTRSQFVKNTLPTIRRVASDDTDEATLKPNTLPTRALNPWMQPRPPSPSQILLSPSLPMSPMSPMTPVHSSEGSESLDLKQSGNSHLSVRSPRTDTDRASPTPLDNPDPGNALVSYPFEGTDKAWEYQVEMILKDIYNSVRQERLPLHVSPSATVPEPRLKERPSNTSLAASAYAPRRAGSIISKAPSDGQSIRSKGARDLKSFSNRFTMKNRSKSKFYQASTIGSSRTSLDDGSVWSPTASSTWSRSVFGRTQTSQSSDSLGSHMTGHGTDYGYQQSIGFANALSQSIIREEAAHLPSGDDHLDNGLMASLLEDESLELAGAPWAKEGLVHHKHHLVTTDKKSKDRGWEEVFAVVEKGYVKLFSFSSGNTSTNRHKQKHQTSSGKGAGKVVGGGNWMDSAEMVGTFLLRQTIANALPPPGYSKTRPYVFALSLPTGAVHLFHVGTPEIAREFVTTANYWSARLSKEPLVGGVSNIEYGWSDSAINTALLRVNGNGGGDATRSGAQSAASTVHPPTSPSGRHSRTHSRQHSASINARPSLQGSMRSSIDHVTMGVKARLPGDKLQLAEWKPPTQSMMASTLREHEQLAALTQYVTDVEQDLGRHNELRGPMQLAFTPAHPNARKAMTNWERKSSYLLREIVKFRTYIESLRAAQAAKLKLDAERGSLAAGATSAAAAAAKVASTQAAERDDYDDAMVIDLAKPDTAHVAVLAQ